MLVFKPKTKTVEIEGQKVHLRQLSEGEVQRYLRGFTNPKGEPIPGRLQKERASLLQLCIVDENGEQLYEPEDLGQIEQFPFAISKRLFEVASEFNGMKKDAPPAEDDEDPEVAAAVGN